MTRRMSSNPMPGQLLANVEKRRRTSTSPGLSAVAARREAPHRVVGVTL
jgi:hypothetical protein